ncbi:MAG: hypothetical protein KF884_00955 [Fimbriimonadaceae bacterium]|nr:hypothetical protein [Fimbriimonadaceae bacterium]QYK58664.1 MAG: hypothetical protein KF884_00955 [Fimbriimonadaceae bacterium]
MRLTGLGLLLVAATMVAQDKTGLGAAKPAPLPERPATRSEFYGAADRLTWAAARGLDMPVPAARPYDRGEEPVTRSEVIAHLSRLKGQFSPKFRFTPYGNRVNLAVIDERNPEADRPALKSLVSFGLVAPVGPLAVGPEPTLTVSQAGTALGHFFSQVAALTTEPDPRFTPRMMR